MSITSTDLVLYGSASMPYNDTSGGSTAANIGGALNTAIGVTFTDLTVNGLITAQGVAGNSSSLTVYARNSAGSDTSEEKALNGATAITFTSLGSVSRFLYGKVSVSVNGVVTIGGSGVSANLLAGQTLVTRLFNYASISGTNSYYEKVYWRNSNTGGLALQDCKVYNTGGSTLVAYAIDTVASATGSGSSATNRLTAPTGVYGTAANAYQTAQGEAGGVTMTAAGAGADLANTYALGVWLRLNCATGGAATKDTYTLGISGTST